MTAVRLVPVAPFTIVNLLAGAGHVRFRDFMIGTAVGMTPGIILTLGIMILTVVSIVRRQQTTFQEQMAWVMSNQDTNSQILDHLLEIERRVAAGGMGTAG